MDRKTITSITKLIIEEPCDDRTDPIDIYNLWRYKTGIIIKNPERAFDVLSYINMALKVNKRVLARSLEGVDYEDYE